MPSSGGSVSDAPIEKTVDGQHHQLAYITPGEAQSLVSQGGKPTMTNEGVIAYPPLGAPGTSPGTTSSGGHRGGPPGGGDRDMTYTAPPRDYEPRGHHGGGGGPIVTTPSKADLGMVDAEDEYLAPDKDHWKATQKAIKKHQKGDHYKADWEDWTKEEQDTYQLEMNKLKGTEDVNYSFYKGNEGTTNLSFQEHWKDAVVKHPALKFSPTARFLYTAAKTGKENLTTDYGTYKYGGSGTSGSGRAVDQGGWWGRAKGLLEGTGGGSITEQGVGSNEREAMNIIAPHAPYIVSGTTAPTNSVAANWYQSLGTTSTNQNQFSFANELAAAKAKQAGILGNQSAIGWLAVNKSPFYNFLKENKLDKGIL